MKNKLILLLAVVPGCAGGEGPSPEEQPFVDQIGTVEQPMYMPQPYGAEKGTENGIKGPICSSPWADGECQVPSNKTLDIGFEAGTCSSTWQGYVVKGWNEFVSHISGTGFSVITSSAPKYRVRCASGTTGVCGGGELGFFARTQNPAHLGKHDTQLGTIIHYSVGQIYYCPDNFAAHSVWSVTTDKKKERAAANTVKHELFHLAGWGHYTGSDNHIMKPIADMATSSSSWFTVNYSMPNSMFTAMQCYDPTSDTTPNCPH